MMKGAQWAVFLKQRNIVIGLVCVFMLWLYSFEMIMIKTLHKTSHYLQAFGYGDDYCEYPPRNLLGRIELNFTELRFEDVVRGLKSQGIQKGGHWKPENCTAKHHVAILIPYRNRSEHLNCFLLNMHPIFARQQIAYKIYLIEPVPGITFNRGLLFNIGFIESNKEYEWDCHVFHDVDLLVEDDRTLYTCPPMPTHLAHFISKHNYSINYPTYFGGATVMNKADYIVSNGYSNMYFGWGSEDDDHRLRIVAKNISILNPDKQPLGSYFMFKHERTGVNPIRMVIMKKTNTTEYDKEGLNSARYELFETIITPLYTKFVVYYDEEEYMGHLKSRINITAGLAEEREYWRQRKLEKLRNKIESRIGLHADEMKLVSQLNETLNGTIQDVALIQTQQNVTVDVNQTQNKSVITELSNNSKNDKISSPESVQKTVSLIDKIRSIAKV